MTDGDYILKFKPADKETWRNTDSIEIDLTITFENKTKKFKGIIQEEK